MSAPDMPSVRFSNPAKVYGLSTTAGSLAVGREGGGLQIVEPGPAGSFLMYDGKGVCSTSSPAFESLATGLVAAPSGGDLTLRGEHIILDTKTPTAASHVATKSYVDSVAAGLDIKQAVRAKTTEPLSAGRRFPGF